MKDHNKNETFNSPTARLKHVMDKNAKYFKIQNHLMDKKKNQKDVAWNKTQTDKDFALREKYRTETKKERHFRNDQMLQVILLPKIRFIQKN